MYIFFLINSVQSKYEKIVFYLIDDFFGLIESKYIFRVNL